MKFAIVGGTHGNEPVGLEVMQLFKESSANYRNDFECFWGNPEAYKIKKRYVDYDLNRSFGPSKETRGYEQKRAQEIEQQIKGNFDFILDLHTTTSNMALTAILNGTSILAQKGAALLQRAMPEIKIIEEDVLDQDCTHLGSLCPARITVEVGPVANNVLSSHLVLKQFEMVKTLLESDFTEEPELTNLEYYKNIGEVKYPTEGRWYIHPNIDQNDFCVLRPGDPIFINIDKETISFEGDKPVYPFFVNEAAYAEHRCAFFYAEKRKGFSPS